MMLGLADGSGEPQGAGVSWGRSQWVLGKDRALDDRGVQRDLAPERVQVGYA